jgi:hypothetical protein
MSPCNTEDGWKKYPYIPKFDARTEVSGLHPASKNSLCHAVKNLLDYVTMLLHLQILYCVELNEIMNRGQ